MKSMTACQAALEKGKTPTAKKGANRKGGIRCQLIIEVYTISRIGDIQPKRFPIRHPQKLYKKLLGDRKIHPGKYWRAGRSAASVRCVFLMPHAALQNGVGVKTVSSMPDHSDVHPPHPYPRYEAAAGRGSPNHGRLHGASHEKRKSAPGRKQNFRSSALQTFPGISACGSRCGARENSVSRGRIT